MNSDTIVGREFGQLTSASKDQQGYWTIWVTMTERVTYPSGEQREEKIESMAMDFNFDMAHQLALSSALLELEELVTSKGFDSLIEGREHQRKLEAKNGASCKTNEDTTTQ